MIDRISEIRGIGKFHDCAIGGKQFAKNTIILGSNTGGKSTLTDVFRSLKTGNTAILEGRRRFGFNGDQKITIVDADHNTFTFPSTDWEKGFENIEIFDTQFIDTNIFEGHTVSFEQQRNLNSVIIGAKGRELATEIARLHGSAGELSRKKADTTKEFKRQFGIVISLDDFSNLQPLENPETKINELNKRIEVIENQGKIVNVFEEIHSRLERILNQGTKRTLAQSVESRAEVVASHITKTWKDTSHSRDFLQTGLELTKEEMQNCVFCGQEFDGDAKTLLDAYSELFSKEYVQLQADIVEAVNKFIKWDPVDSITRIPDMLGSVKIEIDITEIDLDAIAKVKRSLDADFGKKARDLAHEMDFGEFDSLIGIFNKIKTKIQTLNDTYVSKQPQSVDDLRRKIQIIELTLKRHSPDWVTFLGQRAKDIAQQDAAEKKRDELRAELKTYSDEVYATHLDTINRVLKELRSDFTIADFRPMQNIVGERERIFQLDFFETHRVNLDATDPEKPNFGNTLSDSDKRVLAFAFFYSLLIHDEKLDEKIIIFDDPFSSFDSDRREATIRLLSNPYVESPGGQKTAKAYRQLIIFTHEKEYFKWLSIALDQPKALVIKPNGQSDGVKKSTIDDCDVQREYLESEDVRNLRKLSELLSANVAIDDFVGWCAKCRKILEGVFKRKYLFELQDEINLRKGPRTFVEKLKNLPAGGFDDQVKFRDFDSLCVSLNIELHDGEATNDGGNAPSVVAHFLNLLKEI